MTRKEIIGKIKLSRKSNIARSNSGLKEEIQNIRKQIVENSFSKQPNKNVHRDLLLNLEGAKERLKQINDFGG